MGMFEDHGEGEGGQEEEEEKGEEKESNLYEYTSKMTSSPPTYIHHIHHNIAYITYNHYNHCLVSPVWCVASFHGLRLASCRPLTDPPHRSHRTCRSIAGVYRKVYGKVYRVIGVLEVH